jgi:hypothetical protein
MIGKVEYKYTPEVYEMWSYARANPDVAPAIELCVQRVAMRPDGTLEITHQLTSAMRARLERIQSEIQAAQEAPRSDMDTSESASAKA